VLHGCETAFTQFALVLPDEPTVPEWTALFEVQSTQLLDVIPFCCDPVQASPAPVGIGFPFSSVEMGTVMVPSKRSALSLATSVLLPARMNAPVLGTASKAGTLPAETRALKPNAFGSPAPPAKLAQIAFI
jgi:hypothetical protein